MREMGLSGTAQVQVVEIDESSVGQRLDNFLLRELKGAPRPLIYRIVRTGEVRVNKKRAKPAQRLCSGDQVRIPPVRIDQAEPGKPGTGLQHRLARSILFEDNDLLIMDKPSGLAVHGGSGLSLGLIECLRYMKLGGRRIELVHRLDRETSGCLVLAKNRTALVCMHDALRSGQVEKKYSALVHGRWPKRLKTVDVPLKKNALASGERIVRVQTAGKQALTHFSVVQDYGTATLLEVALGTGRTHQIRVHAQFVDHPILGDEKYGSRQSEAQTESLGLKRLFLHASELVFLHPVTRKPVAVSCPLPSDLQAVRQTLS